MSDEREALPTPAWPEDALRNALDLAPLSGREAATFSTISTDSRAIRPGSLFVALKGERFDGHDHLSAAAAAGAIAAVVRKDTPAVPGLLMYEVGDTLRAFGRLAQYRRLGMD